MRLLLSKGHSCYRPRRTGERKRKSVRGCIVGPDLSVLSVVIVKQGDDNLEPNPADDDELDRLDQAPGLTLHSRLACQAVVKGDVTVEIPGWNRNYISEGGFSTNLGNAIPPPKK